MIEWKAFDLRWICQKWRRGATWWMLEAIWSIRRITKFFQLVSSTSFLERWTLPSSGECRALWPYPEFLSFFRSMLIVEFTAQGHPDIRAWLNQHGEKSNEKIHLTRDSGREGWTHGLYFFVADRHQSERDFYSPLVMSVLPRSFAALFLS